VAKAEAPKADHRPLSERIRPQTIDEIVGNRRSIDELLAWANAWARSTKPPRWRAAILAGPPGTGKTTAALALARDLGWTVVEMNASDARNQAAVEQVAGRASLTHTLGDTGTYRSPSQGGRTLILVDEADCMTGGRATETAGAGASPSTLREFLAGRYGSVEALNKAWGLGNAGRPARFESWAQVPTTGGRGAWTRLAEAQHDLSDWKGAARPVDSSDRGGFPAIVRLARETRQPVIFTVNDEEELRRRASGLRQVATTLWFGPVRETEMRAFLRRTVSRERLAVSPAALDAIVVRSRGDVRAAVNDLEAVAPLPPGPLQVSVLALRDISTDLLDLTGTVLSQPRFYRSVEISGRVDATPDDLWPYVEENLPRFADGPIPLDRALGRLARAELFLARARRQRVWALWSFASELMTGGTSIALASDGHPGSGTVAFPQFLREMGQSRAARSIRDGLLLKAGHAAHASKRKSNDAFLPLLRMAFDPDAGQDSPAWAALRRGLARDLGLTPDEVAFLGGDPLPEEAPPPPTTPPEMEEPPAPPERPRSTGPRKVQKKLGEF
jgi:DNA polymerase III delta prime subunit